MDPLILAERNAKAQASIQESAESLADKLGLPEGMVGMTQVRYPQDPAVERLFQAEATATLLRALDKAIKPKGKGKKAPENPELKPEDPTIPPPLKPAAQAHGVTPEPPTEDEPEQPDAGPDELH